MKTLLTILLFITFTAKAEDFYVSTTGNSGNPGSLASPWDLRTALRHPAAVDPGDNIWIRGGTYTDTITAFLTGTLANPIKVRNYNNERVVIDGTLEGDAIKFITTLIIRGAYTWYWGLEITNSDPERTITQEESNPPERRGEGVQAFGIGIKMINCMIYDTGEGIFSGEAATNSEYYGNIIFNNGWDAPDRLHGHGIYTQNDAGLKSFKDNIVFNNFGYGLHAYTEGGNIKHFYFEGNIDYNDRFFLGGHQEVIGLQLISNYSYKDKVQLGYTDTRNDSLTMTNNYFASGIDLLWWKNVTATGNTIFAATAQGFPWGSPFFIYYEKDGDAGPPNLPDSLKYNFNNNTYYRWNGEDEEDFFFFWDNTATGQGFGTFDLPAWQAAGQDATIHFETFPRSTEFFGLVLSGRSTFVRQNTYDANRSHVVIYNWDSLSTINVGVAGILSAGDTYELHNTSDYFNDVVTGTFAGGDSLSIDMDSSNHTVALPLGYDTLMGPNTFPEFGTFVLIKTGTASILPHITTVPDRGQSGVIRSKPDRGTGNRIRLKSTQ